MFLLSSASHIPATAHILPQALVPGKGESEEAVLFQRRRLAAGQQVWALLCA